MDGGQNGGMEQREYHSQLHCFTWWSPSLKGQLLCNSPRLTRWFLTVLSGMAVREWSQSSGETQSSLHWSEGSRGTHTFCWSVCACASSARARVCRCAPTDTLRVYNCFYSTEFIIECDLQALQASFNRGETLCMCVCKHAYVRNKPSAGRSDM